MQKSYFCISPSLLIIGLLLIIVNPALERSLGGRVKPTYFGHKYGDYLLSRQNHYHRPRCISLLCSEWEQVGQHQYSPHTYVQKDLQDKLIFSRKKCGLRYQINL